MSRKNRHVNVGQGQPALASLPTSTRNSLLEILEHTYLKNHTKGPCKRHSITIWYYWYPVDIRRGYILNLTHPMSLPISYLSIPFFQLFDSKREKRDSEEETTNKKTSNPSAEMNHLRLLLFSFVQNCRKPACRKRVVLAGLQPVVVKS